MFFTLIDRSIPNTDPYGNPVIRADGLSATLGGWPTSARIEALRAAWLDAGSLDEQRRICVELQMQLWQDVPYIPLGEYWQSTAYRKDLLDKYKIAGSYEIPEIEVILTESYIGQSSTDASGIGEAADIERARVFYEEQLGLPGSKAGSSSRAMSRCPVRPISP